MRYGQSATIAATIASLLQARRNCIASGNSEWQARHEAALNYIADNLLPSGSGIDNGTAIDWTTSTDSKIVLHMPFHHMDEHGYYDGWTDYTVIVRPDWDGVRIAVQGKDRSDTKNYLAELLDDVLGQIIRSVYDETTDTLTYERVERLGAVQAAQ